MPAKISGENSQDEAIVVPLDGSRFAEVALPYAEELGTRTGSDIVVLSVFESADIDTYKEYQIYTRKIIVPPNAMPENTWLYPAVKRSGLVRRLALVIRLKQPSIMFVNRDTG